MAYYRYNLGFTDKWTFGEKDGGIQRDDMRLLFYEDPDFVLQINNQKHRLHYFDLSLTLIKYLLNLMTGKFIWLLGCNRNGQFSSQVLYNDDGKDWQTLNAPWLPRGGIAATVHKNKMYMTGGKYGGTPDHPDFRYDNDVWTLEKK